MRLIWRTIHSVTVSLSADTIDPPCTWSSVWIDAYRRECPDNCVYWWQLFKTRVLIWRLKWSGVFVSLRFPTCRKRKTKGSPTFLLVMRACKINYTCNRITFVAHRLPFIQFEIQERWPKFRARVACYSISQYYSKSLISIPEFNLPAAAVVSNEPFLLRIFHSRFTESDLILLQKARHVSMLLILL